MIDAGYERFLWPGDRRSEKYCLEPVYLTDCNKVFVSFFLFIKKNPPPSPFRKMFLIIIIIIIIATTNR